MKSKNVKSISYAKGPKPLLFKDCPIVENTLDWLAASFCTFWFLWGLFIETRKPLGGCHARLDIALGGNSCFSTHGTIAFLSVKFFVGYQ